jgi:hypothetical protein
MQYTALCLPITLAATDFAGFVRSIEHHPDRWVWPQTSLEYCRYRLHELTGDLLSADTGTAVQL